MSKPALEDLFRFSGRRNRKSYLLASLALFSMTAILSLILTRTAAPYFTPDAALPGTIANAASIAIVVALLAIAVSSLAIGSQRLRDCDWSGWWFLMLFIPYVGFAISIAMLFIPGTRGSNRFGADPIG